MSKFRAFILVTFTTMALYSCSDEANLIETNELNHESSIIDKRSNTVAEEIGQQLASITQTFENLSFSDKSLFINTANSSMSDTQKENILNANPNTQLLMQNLVQLSIYLNQQGLNQSTLQAMEDDITNKFIDDLDLPAQAYTCEAAYTACMTTVLLSCFGMPPCVVGGMAVCTAVYAACLADSGAFGVSDKQYVDTNGNIHPLNSTLQFFNM